MLEQLDSIFNGTLQYLSNFEDNRYDKLKTDIKSVHQGLLDKAVKTKSKILSPRNGKSQDTDLL